MTTKVSNKPTSTSLLARVVAVVALACGLFAVGAASAGAATACSSDGYDYGSSLTLTTAQPTATPGSDVVITGTGFGPAGCEVTITVDGAAVGTVVVGEDGTFTYTWRVPADQALGDVEIAAVADGAVLAATTVEIVAATPIAAPVGGGQAPVAQGVTGQGTLPATGSKTVPLIIGGLALLAMGAGLLTWTNRRRSASGI